MAHIERETWALFMPISAESPTCIVEIPKEPGAWEDTWRALLGARWATRLDAGLKRVRK
jgi:hypothetical protein